MPTKRQIAARKAVATRRARAGVEAPARATGGAIEVKYGRMGINGVKTALVAPGTTHEAALRQAGVELNPAKEGIQDKKTGNTVMFADVVVEGTYIIAQGINSSL